MPLPPLIELAPELTMLIWLEPALVEAAGANAMVLVPAAAL